MANEGTQKGLTCSACGAALSDRERAAEHEMREELARTKARKERRASIAATVDRCNDILQGRVHPGDQVAVSYAAEQIKLLLLERLCLGVEELTECADAMAVELVELNSNTEAIADRTADVGNELEKTRHGE